MLLASLLFLFANAEIGSAYHDQLAAECGMQLLQHSTQVYADTNLPQTATSMTKLEDQGREVDIGRSLASLFEAAGKRASSMLQTSAFPYWGSNSSSGSSWAHTLSVISSILWVGGATIWQYYKNQEIKEKGAEPRFGITSCLCCLCCSPFAICFPVDYELVGPAESLFYEDYKDERRSKTGTARRIPPSSRSVC